jgi:hypothetical protein
MVMKQKKVAEGKEGGPAATLLLGGKADGTVEKSHQHYT